MGTWLVLSKMGNGLFYQSNAIWTNTLLKFENFLAIFFCQTHPSPNVLYVQVGNGTEDHQFWGRPEDWDGSDPRLTLKATVLRPGYCS